MIQVSKIYSDRMAWVVAFCLGPFGGNERTWKPFNPILGETFELDIPANGVRFLAEQVCSSLRPSCSEVVMRCSTEPTIYCGKTCR